MLRHSADMMARDAASGSPHPPLYDQAGVDLLSYIFQGLDPGSAFHVGGSYCRGLSVTPFESQTVLVPLTKAYKLPMGGRRRRRRKIP